MLSYEELQTKYGNLYEEELRIESTYKQAAEDHLQITLNKYKVNKQSSQTSVGRNFITYRIDMLTTAYAEFMEKAFQPKRGVKPTWLASLKTIADAFEDKEALCGMLAYSTLSATIDALSERGSGNLVVNVAKVIAPQIVSEYQYQAFLAYLEADEHDKEKKIFLQGLATRVSPHYRRHYMTVSMEKDAFEAPKLPMDEMITLATQLIVIAEPILEYYTIKSVGQTTMPQLIPTKKYMDGWVRNEQHLLDNCYRLCPTIIPPAPWEDFNHGGYYGDLAPHNRLLRLDRKRSSVFHKNYMRFLLQADITNVLKAVNGIQATPWTINKKVLSVVNDIVKIGGNRAGIPNINEDPKPVVLPDNPTEEEVAHYKKVMPSWYRGETRRKSIVLRALSHINVANEFQKYDKIYFPCNFDFRGRLYPIPSFNFQGDDLNKALLLFADPPAFDDPEDEDWFYITGSNIAGHDKISYADRIQWVKDNHDNIMQSAADPLGYRWWEEQDAPCQMLAYCFEYEALIKYKEAHGSSIGFITGLPSHQDGTCSGLQHFSAILRDSVGGTAVNLVPQDKPNDIYARVADVVNEMLKDDALYGDPDETDKDGKVHYGSKSMAQLWMSFGVNRKVTKRSTMTLCYGARRYGFRDQIMEDVIDQAMIKQGEKCVFNDYNKWKASSYMANVIWEAVHKVVIKACEGMDWLQTCSRLVSSNSKPVTWVTPLGLPVQQSYLDNTYKVIRMSVMGKRIRVYIPEQTGDINKRKQGSGIAPNFIHSMDAAHLQLAINYCLDAGMKHFSTIHDSYGCPMAQTKLMYKLVRKAFVDMYTENDVLANFRADMKKLTNKEIPNPPTRGDLNLDVVLDSKYVFC